MPLTIPLTNQTPQMVICNLEGIDTSITIWWQPEGHWYLSVERPVNVVIARGLRLILDTRISLPDTTSYLVCRSLSPPNVDPLLGAWGVTHELRFEIV